MRNRIAAVTVVLLTGFIAACGDDDASPPTTGSVQVTTQTSGSDIDADGYTVAVGTQSRAIGINSSETFNGVAPGATTVTLSGVAGNCSVTTPNPVNVTVVAGSSVSAAFSVTCDVIAPDTYLVGGSVTGLTGAGLVLQNNAADDETVAADGPFVFDTALDDGSAYAVTVLTQPAGQTCSVADGSGTISGADVTNVAVTCSDNPTCSVGGTVSGLTGAGLVLQNNGGDDQAIAADGGYAFATELDDGAAYAVTVLTQPAGQSCSVANGSGTIAGADVTDADVTCTDLLGNLDVTTITGGADLDVDGYIVTVGSESQNVGINATANFVDLPVGTVSVELTDVQSNCSVGGNPVNVDIQDGQTAAVTFTVTCVLVPGAVGKIAFSSNRTGSYEIWTMNTDGTGQAQLTFFDDEAGGPAYRPDGTRILFWSRHEGGSDIFIMNPDGSGVINLTNSAAEELFPSWCSDGQFYTYVRKTGSTLKDVWVANLPGTVRYNLTKSSTSNDEDPRWSPDCTKIAFTSDRDGLPNQEIYEITVADVANPAPVNLTNNADGNQRDGRPEYSPDGTQIAFDSNRNGFSADIWVMDSDGANPVVILQNDPETDYAPTWSPDGSRIAFVKNGTAQKDIWIMDADGTNDLRLTTDGAEDDSPDFSP